MVVTSHDKLGGTGMRTGFWLEEFAAPYYIFKDAGASITIASPKGGQPPVDPKSEEEGFLSAYTKRFAEDADAQKRLSESIKLDEALKDHSKFDALFYPGGHGPLWDLTNNPKSIELIQSFWNADKPVGAVCHGPCVLINAKNAKGAPLVKGKRLTAFTNSEEDAVGLTKEVPFSLQNELTDKGADFSVVGDWTPHVVVHGKLVTGQNPQSSEQTAKEIVRIVTC